MGLLILASTGCHRAPTTQTAGIPGPMASALLAFAAQNGSSATEVVQAWRRIEDIAARVAGHARAGQHPEDTIAALNAVVFGELGFSRQVESTAPRFLLLPSVLSGRQGGCVGLGALFLTIAERLHVPLSGVLVPGHFFVRTGEERPRNIELLRQGETMPDAWYRTKYGPWSPTATAYQRPLSVSEVLAVHWYNVGNQQRAEGQLPRATESYRRALLEFPNFAEAAASLGGVDQLQGDLAAAEAAYRAASRAWPGLPGLARNLSLLEAERLGRRPTVTSPQIAGPTPGEPPIQTITRRSRP